LNIREISPARVHVFSEAAEGSGADIEEAEEGAAAAERLGGGAIHARPVHLPGLDDVRAILSVTKKRSTPKAYPARKGRRKNKG